MLDKYTVLINKQNPVSKDFYKNYEIMETSGVENDIVKIEKLTFEKYENLKKYLNKTENIEIGILNAYRDFNEQEKICKEYEKIYGIEKAYKLAAVPGTSEHHSGLAIDITVKKDDGNFAITNDELYSENENFLKVHRYLSMFGFILRYPESKTKITEYDYEPWHIRYVGEWLAKLCYNEKKVLEEYYSGKK